MPSDIARALRSEITRLARKEVRGHTESMKRAAAQYRRDIAELKRTVRKLSRKISLLESQEKKRLAQPVSPKLAEGARFSPNWLKKHRRRLGLSAADYAALVGVHQITIYNWEQGKSKPRKEQLAALVAVRKLGKREARMRLEMLQRKAG